MESQTNQQLNIPLDLGHDKLLSALFFIWDGFERATMNFFLVKDTAKQIIEGKNLSGDKITLGIRRMEWNGGQQRVFKAFMEHNKMTPKSPKKGLIVFNYQDTPIYLYIYEENPCLTSFDTVFYNNETFNTPNPFKRFNEEFDKL